MPKKFSHENSFESWCITNNKKAFLEEWDYQTNELKPSDVSHGTHREFNFICSKCGTHFKRQLHYFQPNGDNGCPKCWLIKRAETRHKTAAKKNNLLKNYPKIAAEWSSKNDEKPDEISFNDNKKYWWKCNRCGKEWQASVVNRVKGKGCPKCKYIYHTSFPEQAIFYYVRKYYPDAINGDKHLGIEFDIYIPSKKVAIEYDGEQWHQNIKKDEKKNQMCFDNQIVLCRIRERNCWFWAENDFLRLIPCASGNNKELENAINVLLIYLNVIFADVNLERDKSIILSNYITSKEKNSLQTKYPQIAKEWHPTKNAPLTPSSVDYGSGISVYWICSKCGFEYKSTLNSRTCKGNGCPACSHKVAFVGKTDFVTLYPELIHEWNFEKKRHIKH